MLIIIEGADKTGKTTLAKAISKEFGYEYKHFGAPKGSPADEYMDFLLKLDKPTVCDRFHLGELVYGPMLRGKTGITSLELVTLERVMRLKQTILIHVTANMILTNQRLVNSAEHEMVNGTQNVLAANAFDRLIPLSNVGPILRYDGSSLEKLRLCLFEITKLERSFPIQCLDYSGIGTTAGFKIVFVGEQVNKNVTWRGLPFDRGMASQFLLDTFKEAGVPENQVYICNADKLTLREMENLVSSGSTTFVTLGKKADEKLKSFGFAGHYSLAHPQFIKRFHFKRKDFYTAQLKEIMVCV